MSKPAQKNPNAKNNDANINHRNEQHKLAFSELLARSIKLNQKPTKKIAKVQAYLQNISSHY